jgi:hypothetical protein
MRKIIIKNYKNIGVEKEAELNIPDRGGLCVVLGENNAGKSNVLGALRSFGIRSLNQSAVPNYSFSTKKNTAYVPEISLYSDNFFGEDKRIEELKINESDFPFEIVQAPDLQEKFYGNVYSIAMNQNTFNATIKQLQKVRKDSGIDAEIVANEFNEEFLAEPHAFAYFGLSKAKDGTMLSSIFLCMPKMKKIFCIKANNSQNTHTFEIYLVKDFTQADMLQDFTKAIPLSIRFKFYKRPEDAEAAVQEEGFSDALEIKDALERFSADEKNRKIEKSSLKNQNKNAITYTISYENGKTWQSFFRARDKKGYKGLLNCFELEDSIQLSSDTVKEALAQKTDTESFLANVNSIIYRDKKKLNANNEDAAFLEKVASAVPNIYEFDGREIKDSELHIKRDNIKDSIFFNQFFEKLGISLEDIEEAYTRKQMEMELRGVSRAVKEKEDEINDLIKTGFTKRFNQLYYGSKDGEKYNFQILLDEETISLIITRGKNSLALAIQEQSTGFRKFFGMFFDFLFQSSISEGDIVLIDEVETHLSIPVQREVRAFLKSFGEEHGITFIVTTHSNFIVDARNLDEVRIVRPLGGNKGTTIINDFSAIPEHQADTLAEIKRALGVGAISLLNKDDRLVFVEGITDYSYLTGMYSLYQKENKDAPKLLFLPICGLGSFDKSTFDPKKIAATDEQKEIKEALLDLAYAAREDKAFLLVDGDRAGSAMATLADGDNNFEVATIREVPELVKGKIKDIENMFCEETRLKYHMVDKNHSASSSLKNDLIAGRHEPTKSEKENFKKLFEYIIEKR